ncbi:glycosyltransferase [Novosphingobium album (ex Liu et al. 2023)]|uniref:Glycosyltransferase n=1 Tax=Novosphingobium album (ex Liu et al. 2023) TaxID=3031130 RepID=A0ABT5WKB9_9SPHN|nr:glycosyltransferase [Novosphingobium album (ex Liu et al. 2023)]MDE8650480.1 glycosyltransferase [Novosphingobium album (ex Liu et al. 2023)]
MRVGLLTAWANRANGGVFEAVATHAAMLRERGMTPHVFALAHPDDERDRARFDGIAITTVPVLGPAALGWGSGVGRALRAADLDLLHLHGIWTHLSADGARWADRTGRPYVISPHGMLDPWIVGRGRAKKALARAWFERGSWRAASAFHALTGAEAGDIASATGREAITVIPNGIAIPEAAGLPLSPPTVLSIGRIHPKKNILALVEAWREAGAGKRGWKLVIAGWGADSDVAALRAALGAAPEAEGMTFLGPVFGDDKERLLRAARCVILPSHSEGLPMAILEAWAAGVPTIMTEASHLPEGFAAGAAIRIGARPDEIAEGLRVAMDLPEAEWAVRARAARGLASGHFSTEVVAARWIAFYRELAASVKGSRG